jgi:ABC-2 type transport system ATP-binding protein
VLFAKLADLPPNGSALLPHNALAPMRVTGLPTDGSLREVPVTLAAIVHTFPAGHRLQLTVSSTDFAYANERTPAIYHASLGGPSADGNLQLPVAPPVSDRGLTRLLYAFAAGFAMLLLLIGAVILSVRRKRARLALAPAGRDDVPPVVIEGVSKVYESGLRAVDDVSFTVERGQVCGLLGPNGAGKTTLLRMLLGLTRPTAGTIRLFGERVTPGGRVFERVGALVEGPGFLPHLTGIDNLRLWWQANGRPLEAADFEFALGVAGLGTAVNRKVRTYSHGMRQRLAIAQALLSRPDLLVLDEPTNGLDPPEIRELRELLQRVARSGRTVLVSSHLLAEVEQTCSHVVVMGRGKLIATGAVAELIGNSSVVALEVDDAQRALDVVRELSVQDAAVTGDGQLRVELDGLAREDLVAELVRGGVGVQGVSARRRLEDVFLSMVGDDTVLGAGERSSVG